MFNERVSVSKRLSEVVALDRKRLSIIVLDIGAFLDLRIDLQCLIPHSKDSLEA